MIVLTNIVHLSFFCFFILVILLVLIPENYYVELLSHFSVFLFFVSIPYLTFYILYKNRFFLVLSIFTGLFTAYPCVRLLSGSEFYQGADKGEDISILQFNICNENQNVRGFLAYIEDTKFPDIVVIQEATPYTVEQLTSLRIYYPYMVEAPKWGPYGMILFSKIPIIKNRRYSFEKTSNMYSLIEFKTKNTDITFAIIELHATSPLGDSPTGQLRRQELREMGVNIFQLSHKYKILLGDLNTTPYSPYFQKLLKDSGLKNTMQGQRIQGTWPSFLPKIFRIPLDHLLVADNICVIKQTICPSLGSDHMPLLTQIRLSR